MGINGDRYKSWSDAVLQAFADGDAEVMALKWAEDGSYVSIDSGMMQLFDRSGTHSQ